MGGGGGCRVAGLFVGPLVSLAALSLSGGAAIASDAPPAMTVPGTFAVNSAGAATYTIPIVAPPGTAGMAPALTLNYSSQVSDGIVGFGWQLGGLSAIGRCPRTPAQDSTRGSVNYDSNDRFCLDGERLMLISGTYGAANSEYRTENESFTKIIAYGTAGSGPSYFKAWLRTGQVIEFGNTTDSRILAVGTSTARTWTENKVTDVKGNYLTVTYTNDTTNGQYYPTEIDYTGNAGASVSPYNSVQFTYNTSRSDVTPTYQSGSLIKTTVLLTHIKTYNGANVVLDYQLGYRAGTSTTHSRLTSVTLCDTGGSTCLAPTTFGWQGGTGQLTMSNASTSIATSKTPLAGDFDGDGLTDALILNKNTTTSCTSWPVYLGSSSGLVSSSVTLTESPGNTPSDCWITSTGTIDLEPNGKADPLIIYNYRYVPESGHGLSTHRDNQVFRSNGTGFTALTDAIGTGYLMFGGDFNGDGRGDYFLYSSASTNYAYLSNGSGTFTADGGHSISTTYSLQAGDFDGDGCTDYYGTSTSADIVSLFCNPAVSSITPPSRTGYSSEIVGDFNGDGKSDLLYVSTSGAGALYFSTGTGFTASSYSVPTGWGNYQIYTGDFDGDGKTDLLLVSVTSGTSHKLYLSTGNGFTQAVDGSNTAITISNSDTNGTATVADWNNDGGSDFWLQKASGDLLYTFSYTPELMTSISNGVGATTSITYDRINKNGSFYSKGSNTYPITDIDGAYYVVKEIDRSNGIGGNASWTYAYSGGYGNINIAPVIGSRSSYWGYGGTQATSGKLLGFGQIVVTDGQTGVVTTTNYRNDFPYIGLASSQTAVTTGSSSGCSSSVTLRSLTNTWASSSTSGVYKVTLSQSVESGHDCNGASLPTKTTTYTYDSYGNASAVAVSLSDGSSFTTTNTITNDTTNWILGQVTASATENVVGSSDITRHMAYTHDSSTGIVTEAVVESGVSTCNSGSASCTLTTDYTIDAFGHAATTQLSGSGITTRSSSIGYDANGRFQTSHTNALSQSDSWDYSSTASKGFGVPTSQTDPNGLTTAWSYDTFGRLTQTTAPVGTKVLVSYAFCSGVNGGSASCPTYGAYLMLAKPTASDGTTQIGPISTTYYDALGRVIAADTQGFDGSNIRIATQYDSHLNVSQTSRPYFTTGGTAKWTVYTHDALGRVTLATFPDSSTTSYTFNGLTSSVTDALSHTTSQTLNAEGLVASTTDAASNTTNYTYDSFGDVLTVTDSTGSNVITNTYDQRGRKVTSSDPDMGAWSYAYDVLSELTTQTDAKSQSTTLTYDLLGRPLTRDESSFYSAWTYGSSSGSHNIGRLTEAKSCTASGCSTVLADRTFTYDSYARPSTGSEAVGGTTYTTTTTYDTYGRVSTIARPSGFTTQNVYVGTYGYLCRVTDNAGSPTCSSAGGAAVVWTADTANAELQLTQSTAGNSVVTTNTYDANTGQLTNIRAGPSDTVAQFDYTYDTVGNLTYRSDNYQSIFERYCYDSMNRLTNSATGASGVTTCTSSGGGITDKTVAYSAIGNITSKSDVGTYAYPSAGSARPHAVSSVTGTVNGVTNPSYTYDSNGNMTAGAGRTVSYSAFNMVSSIVQGSTALCWSYDADHTRVTMETRSTSCAGTLSSTTTYLNDPASGAMGEKVVGGATTTWSDYITVGGQLVAERSCIGSSPCTSGATLSYFVLDHLGSVAVISNGAGTVTERLSYDAWGRRRNANGTDNSSCSVTSAVSRGYTAHEHLDAVCEINANARIYDPTLGRFVSADSFIPDPLSGQSLNRYSYVGNNPLSATDPSGHGDVANPSTKHGGGQSVAVETVTGLETVVVTGDRIPSDIPSAVFLDGGVAVSTIGSLNAIDRDGGINDIPGLTEILPVTAKKTVPVPVTHPTTAVTVSTTPGPRDAPGFCLPQLMTAGNIVRQGARMANHLGTYGLYAGAVMFGAGAFSTAADGDIMGPPLMTGGVSLMTLGVGGIEVASKADTFGSFLQAMAGGDLGDWTQSKGLDSLTGVLPPPMDVPMNVVTGIVQDSYPDTSQHHC
jgi:RHS repeat-associated protein